MLQFTDSAVAKMREVMQEHDKPYIRFGVKGGGCAGFEYEWGTYATPEEIQDDDTVFKTDTNCTFVIGGTSLMFLFGTEIDYKKDIIGSMFEINNPNAKSSCGCGVSVNFDVDKLAVPAI